MFMESYSFHLLKIIYNYKKNCDKIFLNNMLRKLCFETKTRTEAKTEIWLNEGENSQLIIV